MGDHQNMAVSPQPNNSLWKTQRFTTQRDREKAWIRTTLGVSLKGTEHILTCNFFLING